MSDTSRWNSFTSLEIIVINEALNTCFEDSIENRQWDQEAQLIASTIPPIEDQVSDTIFRYLNGV